MRSHRLNRLALLTQGAALVGLGLSALACGDPPHVNAPPKEPVVAPEPAAPKPEHMNAPPPSGSASPVASGSSSAAVNVLPPGTPPKAPMHVNSPPKPPPPAPTKP